MKVTFASATSASIAAIDVIGREVIVLLIGDVSSQVFL
jgi:hypothetical protein